MHEVLVNRLGGLSLPRKSVVRLTDRPDMTLDVYRGRKTTMQQQQQSAIRRELTLPTLPQIYVCKSVLYNSVIRRGFSSKAIPESQIRLIKDRLERKQKSKSVLYDGSKSLRSFWKKAKIQIRLI